MRKSGEPLSSELWTPPTRAWVTMGVNYQPIKGRYLYMYPLKSTGLLYETQEVGKATAVELAKQREQLEKTSHQLDEINSTLR